MKRSAVEKLAEKFCRDMIKILRHNVGEEKRRRIAPRCQGCKKAKAIRDGYCYPCWEEVGFGIVT